MRIYQMTATFGKLEHQTLTLEPGLNVITAPNEWGKSTWCAFLVAMLYGIDTRSKTTKTTLADKVRYAPWSGHPMEGRIDLSWKGRDITIERKTRNRIPMGEFTAYETATGLPVPELTADNCGQQLLGVEQSVFRRSGFIRLADLPVTTDEALRRRLNSLVTTGDESGDADRLADALKELRNKCRYNRSGLLPQAEARRDALEAKLTELHSLESQCRTLRIQSQERKASIAQLNNHRQALSYAAAERHTQRIGEAQAALAAAQAQLTEMESLCAQLPSREEAETRSDQIRRIRTAFHALDTQQSALPEEPRMPLAPPPFENMSLEDGKKMLHQDTKRYIDAKRNGSAIVLVAMGVLGLICAGFLTFLRASVFAVIAGVGSLAALGWGLYELFHAARTRSLLQTKYGAADQSRWPLPLADFERKYQNYYVQLQDYQNQKSGLQTRYAALKEAMDRLCGDMTPEEALDSYSQVLALRDTYEAGLRERDRAASHLDALKAMEKPVEKPTLPDLLTSSEEDTLRLLGEYTAQQQELENRLNQCQGQMASLGNRNELQDQLTQLVKHIAKLEKTYAALVIAMDTLDKAKEELQRRFAPRITRRAQHWLSEMTMQRYDTLTMDSQFSLRASAQEEDTLRDILWRSDGTMDQLYLALRLAVSEELTPEAPLILDDALVRFDDQRLEATMGVFKQLSSRKQIILFTCQGREQQV